MTPKEKALEMCQKFGNTTKFAEDCNDGYTLPLRVSKLCATIAVDEIQRHTYMGIRLHENDDNSFEYWVEVKQEIQNLSI